MKKKKKRALSKFEIWVVDTFFKFIDWLQENVVVGLLYAILPDYEETSDERIKKALTWENKMFYDHPISKITARLRTLGFDDETILVVIRERIGRESTGHWANEKEHILSNLRELKLPLMTIYNELKGAKIVVTYSEIRAALAPPADAEFTAA